MWKSEPLIDDRLADITTRCYNILVYISLKDSSELIFAI